MQQKLGLVLGRRMGNYGWKPCLVDYQVSLIQDSTVVAVVFADGDAVVEAWTESVAVVDVVVVIAVAAAVAVVGLGSVRFGGSDESATGPLDLQSCGLSDETSATIAAVRPVRGLVFRGRYRSGKIDRWS